MLNCIISVGANLVAPDFFRSCEHPKGYKNFFEVKSQLPSTQPTFFSMMPVVFAGIVFALAATPFTHLARRAKFRMIMRKAVGCSLHDYPCQHHKEQ
jgi:hypothetical protein